MYYYKSDAKEILSEKISAKILTKFADDTFVVDVADLKNKTVLANLAALLTTTRCAVAIYDADDNLVVNIDSYVYTADERVQIAFTNGNFSACGEINISNEWHGKLVTFKPLVNHSSVQLTQATDVKPLFQQIIAAYL